MCPHLSFSIFIYLNSAALAWTCLNSPVRILFFRQKELLALSRFCINVFFRTWQCGVSYGVPTEWERMSYHNLPFISLEMWFTIQETLLSIVKNKNFLPKVLILFQACLCCKVECVCVFGIWGSEGSRESSSNRSLKKIGKYLSCLRKQDSRSHSSCHVCEAPIWFHIIIM